MYNIKIVSNNGRELNFIPEEDLIITNIEGLTSNTVSIATSQGFGQTGTTIQGTAVEDKLITIDGVLLGEATSLRQRLIETVVPEETVKIIFDNKFWISGTAEMTPDIGRNRYNPEFQFAIRTPYPYWRATDETATPLVRNEPKFSFPVNYGDPELHIFGERIAEAYQNINNSGNVAIPFIVVFYAETALSNPSIQRMDTLEYIRIEKDLAAGERITVDMTVSPMKVTSKVGDVTQDAFGYFDIDSTLFKLHIGDNLIKYDAEDNKEGLNCYIYHYFTTAGAYGDDVTYR